MSERGAGSAGAGGGTSERADGMRGADDARGELRLGEPVQVGGATVTPLLVERLRHGIGARTLWAHGERCAVGVLVERNGEVHAFSVDGSEQDVEALARAVPGIAAALGR